MKRRRSKKLNQLVEIGRERMGITDLRPGQDKALEHVLAGKDVLAVMPTGSGKSLLYQLPSLILPGLTVVVSPLIALIKDQVDKMQALEVPVVRIDSTLTVRQRRAMDELLAAEGGKLVLTTPERMADPAFREQLNQGAGGVGVSLFVLDEAHCVSHWGHDFRPAYLVLRKAMEEVGRPPVLATTATAPPHVRDDIKHQMDMADAEIVTTTFDRPNLHYEVIAVPGDDDKKKTLVTLLKKLPKPGLVYCATVRAVEQLYEELSRHKIPVAKYHGRMTKKARDEAQNAFMPHKSNLIMLATNAFGLGVDKRDIRYVLHYHVPGSLEAYAQEAGRGGRDGLPTRCVLLFSPDDIAIQEYFLRGTYPTKRQVRSVVKALEVWDIAGPKSGDDELAAPTLPNVALASGVGKQRTRTILSLLKDEGFVVDNDDNLWSLSDPPPDPAAIRDKARQYEARRIADRQRLDALLQYVGSPGCRNQDVLDYLGEPDAPNCGRCDNDLRSREAAVAAAREATRLEGSVTDRIAEADGEIDKARRVIRHRVVSIDATGNPIDADGDAVPLAVEDDISEPVKLLPEAAGKPDELAELVAAQTADAGGSEDDEYEYEYVDEGEDFVDSDEYEYGEIEVIDRTAAAIAEEGVELEDAEITILKRKQREKPPKQKKKAAAVEPPKKKRRRRRRRRKKKSGMPKAAAFTSPVLGSAEPAQEAPSEATEVTAEPAGGPLVEYVRGSLRINSTPVASATPNDQPGKGRRRRRKAVPATTGRRGAAGGGSAKRKQTPAPPATPAPVASASPTDGDEQPKKKRRRRRRRKGGGKAQPTPATTTDGPISFFSVAVGQGGGNRGGRSRGGNGAANTNSTGNGATKKKRRRRRRRGKKSTGDAAPSSD